MSRFIESIAVQDGIYQLLNWHQQRIDQTFEQFYTGRTPFDLSKVLPDIQEPGLVKLRFVYDKDAYEIAHERYTNRSIQSLKIIHTEALDYRFKYQDRKALDELYKMRGEADDILICQGDRPTDCYYANVCLFDGSKWYTSTSYLLNGVMRQYLLSQNLIKEIPLTLADLDKFEEISLINALNPLGEIRLNLSNLVF